ncbi:MAG: tRNA 2-thiouridine(34) synthase MnmA [Alphaproteobacteria bacterium]|nr:tRNA 2-thiouridine(34) synthase MnmA [Alphaproteobacteria bacterium]
MAKASATPTTRGRVVVAMSGGVDSSVSAALLHKAGCEVIGITLELYGAPLKAGARTCCAGTDRHDARRVAEQLGIPHYVFDLSDRFRETVIDNFADSYLRGETPVPCVQCNAGVKFSDLLDYARDLDASALATGHYVRRIAGAAGAELHCPADGARDQTWFMFATTREQLEFLRFPVGDLRKDEVRRLARDLGLSVADKADSQDICFVGGDGYASLVERLRPGACAAGEIVDVSGRVLGRHDGVIHYTVGQRRGLGLSGGPYYVVRLDAARARVVVGSREDLRVRRVSLRGVNWLGERFWGDGAVSGRDLRVRFRSSMEPVGGCLSYGGGGGGALEFTEPVYGVSAGQAAVFYEGTRMLGGGWISDIS